MKNDNTTDERPLSSDQPIDDQAANLMQTIARKGRGFVLATAAAAGSDGKTTIEVKESLPPHDEYEPLAAWRDHEIRDTTSFIAYATRYGSKDKSLIFYAGEKFTLVIDEQVERGLRETIDMPVTLSPDFEAWSRVLNKPTSHRELVQFLMRQEHNLAEGGVLTSMQSLRLNSTINLESDVKEEGNNFAIMVKTNAGDELRKFPKQFSINVPVLKSDVDVERLDPAIVRLNIVLPTEAKQGPVFTLYCSAWDQILIRRIEREGDLIRKQLDGWTVVHGKYRTGVRSLGGK